MATGDVFQNLYLAYLSDPKADRVVYRTIWRQRVQRILELGIGTGRRAVRMIRMAQRCSPESTIRYTGFDLFESRRSTDGPGLSLKLAHRTLGATGAQVRLIPGDPLAALASMTNRVGTADLLLFSSRIDPRRLAETWFYVPRLMEEQTQVFIGSTLPGGREIVRQIAREEIDALASTRRRAA